jgi:nitroreductase
MNETLRNIAERFSCRDYSDKVPTSEQLNLIAQAAIQAPSGMNRQLWQVIVVKNRDLMSEMEAEGMKTLSSMPDQTMYQRIMERGGKLFYHAPCMIVLAIKEGYPKGAELVDCGILAQNTVLAATSLGINTVHCGFIQLAFAGEKASYFKEKLKFPEGYECGMAVLLGYANTSVSPHMPDQEKITVIE